MSWLLLVSYMILISSVSYWSNPCIQRAEAQTVYKLLKAGLSAECGELHARTAKQRGISPHCSGHRVNQHAHT
jgi:hypothetical protein